MTDPRVPSATQNLFVLVRNSVQIMNFHSKTNAAMTFTIKKRRARRPDPPPIHHPPPIKRPPPIQRADRRNAPEGAQKHVSYEKHGQTYARSDMSTRFMVTSGVG